jgi:hypothetical protein
MDDVEMLRKALAAEHAAVFAYGLIGARTSGSVRTKVNTAFDKHRARRDQLRSAITARGGKPTEAEASYTLPIMPDTAANAVRLAVYVEAGMLAAYLELVAASDGSLRKYAALAMQEAATRSYSLRPVIAGAFPGMTRPTA